MAFCAYCDEPVAFDGEQDWVGGDRKDTYRYTNSECHSHGGTIWVAAGGRAVKEEGVY